MFKVLFFATLVLFAAADGDFDDKCDSTDLVNYILNNHNNGLIDLSCNINNVVNGDTVDLVHQIRLDLSESFASQNYLRIDTYFEEAPSSPGEADFDSLAVNGNTNEDSTSILVEFPHEDFLKFKCQVDLDGFNAVYKCHFYVDFYNLCQHTVMKTFRFFYTVTENRSITGQIELISNKLEEIDDDCDNCVSEINYTGVITVYTDSDNDVDVDVETAQYKLGDIVYLSLASREVIPHFIAIDSIKQVILSNNHYEEVIDHAQTNWRDGVQESITYIRFQILVPVNFRVEITGHIDTDKDLDTPERLLAVDRTKPKFFAMHGFVVSADTGSEDGSSDDAIYMYALVGVVSVSVLAIGYMYFQKRAISAAAQKGTEAYQGVAQTTPRV